MPEMSETELIQAINDGKMTLLSIDTNIFERYNNGLEYGLLKRLSQFVESEIELVLSEIVYRELRGHMNKRASEAIESLNTALKLVGNAWDVSKDKRDSLREEILGQLSATEIVNKRLDQFQSSTDFKVVPADGYAAIAQIVDAYFTASPPFGTKAGKKHEFPDAIAVRSLESYAEQQGTLMLAVSNDGGWKDYCATSARLVCVSDLPTAMAYLQRLPLVIAAVLSQRFDDGDLKHLRDAIESELKTAIESSGFHIEASANYYYEHDLPDVTFLGIAYFDEPKFNVIDHDAKNETYVLEVSAAAAVEVSCDFTFFVTDGFDKDQVPIGSVEAVRKVDLWFGLTATIVGNPESQFDVVEVEVVRGDTSVDFDFIEPDFSSPDD